MDPHVASFRELLDLASQTEGRDLHRAIRRARWIAEASDEQVAELLRLIADRQALAGEATAALIETLFILLQQRSRESKSGFAADWVTVLRGLHARFPADSGPAAALLGWLAMAGTRESLALFVQLLITSPPTDERLTAMVLSPLFQRDHYPAEALFPSLLQTLAHPSLAAAVLDLGNFLFRQKRLAPHPAADRKDELLAMLNELTNSLERLEERPDEKRSPQEVGQIVARSVALTVAVCDTLALLGDPAAIPRLQQTLDLHHRRIRTEAAAALARLGDERGREELVQLAAEPVARLRVLAYAEELGLMARVDPEFATPEARAEAELVVRLAEPTQFGIPPGECELIDRRKQNWPGYREPVDCFLFRFTYRVTIEGEGERTYSNIGIAGPVAHAFTADLADLPPDDIYAAYAGWQAEHPDIMEVEVERLSKSEKLEVTRLERRLHDAGYRDVQPQFMGYLFGEKALAANCTREGTPGTAIVDFDDAWFFPARRPQRAVGPREAYCIYKGRKLLKAFNPAS